MLEGEGHKDYPYPFSLVHLDFYQCCRDAMQRAERWLPLPRSHVERRILKQLSKILDLFDGFPRPGWALPRLEKNKRAFSEVRDILRITDAELPRGDERYLQTKEFPALEIARLHEIKQAITRYREQLKKQVVQNPGSSDAGVIILKYFDRYNDHLFGHPAKYDHKGAVICVVERTNNVAEHFFGADKRRLRRRLGRAHLGRDLENQPAQAVFTNNLRHADYVRVLCGSMENLPAAFASLDQKEMQETTPLERDNRDAELLRRVCTLMKDERRFQSSEPAHKLIIH